MQYKTLLTTASIEQLLKEESLSDISKNTGIPITTLKNYRSGATDLESIPYRYLQALTEYTNMGKTVTSPMITCNSLPDVLKEQNIGRADFYRLQLYEQFQLPRHTIGKCLMIEDKKAWTMLTMTYGDLVRLYPDVTFYIKRAYDMEHVKSTDPAVVNGWLKLSKPDTKVFFEQVIRENADKPYEDYRYHIEQFVALDFMMRFSEHDIHPSDRKIYDAIVGALYTSGKLGSLILDYDIKGIDEMVKVYCGYDHQYLHNHITHKMLLVLNEQHEKLFMGDITESLVLLGYLHKADNRPINFMVNDDCYKKLKLTIAPTRQVDADSITSDIFRDMSGEDVREIERLRKADERIVFVNGSDDPTISTIIAIGLGMNIRSVVNEEKDYGSERPIYEANSFIFSKPDPRFELLTTGKK